MGGQVILHVGAPKCGSTYLQRVLLKNQRLLRAQGINYPHAGPGHPGNAALLDHISPPWLTRNMDGFDTIILSHENLFGTAKRGIRLATICQNAGMKLRIVAFLRAFPDWLAADFSQTLRQYMAQIDGTTLPPPFKEFVIQRRDKIAAHQFVLDWQSLMANAPITVASHLSIQSVMVGLLPSLEQIDWSLPPWATNQSMGRRQCDQVQAALADGSVHKAAILARQTSPKEPIPADERLWINTLFAAERQGILQDFGVAL